MKPRHLALAFSCVLLWGGSFAVIRWGMQDLPPMAFASLRFACVAVFAVLLPPPAVPWKLLVAYGLAWGAIQFGGLFLAIHAGLPSGLGSVLAQSQAFFTLLLVHWIGGEELRPAQYVVVGLAIAGIVLVCLDQDRPIPGAALIAALAGAAGWALGNLIVRHIQIHRGRADSLSFVSWASIVPMLVLASFSVLLEDVRPTQLWQSMNAGRALVAVAYQGVAALLLGTLAWNRLLRHYPASAIAPFSLLVPCIGLVMGGVLFHESLGAAQSAGCALFLAALLIHVMRVSTERS